MIFKDMEELKRHLRIGIPLPCYFIGGTDDQRKRAIVNKIIGITTEGGTGFDTHRFSGNVSADTVGDAAFEITFGGGRRCVVCEDLPFGSMGENEYKKFEQLVSEVSEMGGSTVLVFAFYSVETEPKKDSKSKTESKTGKKSRIESLKKLIDKVSGGVIKCETPTPAELGSMIEKTCAKYKCSIHRDLCSYMIERCGSDSALLMNEARKVAEYKGSGIISKADIDLMTCATPDAKVFDLSAKISAKDRTGAFSVLQELREMGESAPLILNILSGMYIDMFRAKAARSAGKTKFDIAADFPKSYPKPRQFLIDRALTAQSRYSSEALLQCIDTLLDAEQRMKSTGGDGDIILDETVAKLFSIK
ncbi:MAG: hypothetical protein IIU57_00335 [Oscillospiraceae bacterium]|nr:hypothetical protein [Oscillospiraceae bacterium]